METKTKFNIGERIYGFNNEHKLVEFEIARIFVVIDGDGVMVINLSLMIKFKDYGNKDKVQHRRENLWI